MEIRRAVRILVIDDNQDFCDNLKLQADIYHPNYQAECVFYDSEADLEFESDRRPSVVLLDAHQTNSTAAESIRRLSANGAPVFITSSSASLEISTSVLTSGAAGYLPKSSNPDDFEALFDMLVEVAAPLPVKH